MKVPESWQVGRFLFTRISMPPISTRRIAGYTRFFVLALFGLLAQCSVATAAYAQATAQVNLAVTFIAPANGPSVEITTGTTVDVLIEGEGECTNNTMADVGFSVEVILYKYNSSTDTWSKETSDSASGTAAPGMTEDEYESFTSTLGVGTYKVKVVVEAPFAMVPAVQGNSVFHVVDNE